ncbi:MAG: SpoIIE family protein phosphatase [Thermoanaerobaculia bacterium]|nr:SpoIIE family protein phosphatase [Thermoanaerobaculia bacterium]
MRNPQTSHQQERRKISKSLAALLISCLPAAASVAEVPDPFRLTVETFSGEDGSNPSWVALPDEAWTSNGEVVSVWWPPGEQPLASWDGEGRFRLRVDVAADLVGVPLGCAVEQRGAFELRIDDVWIDGAGDLPGSTGNFRPRNQDLPAVFSFRRAGVQDIEVSYANPRIAAFHRNGHAGGFQLNLAPADFALGITNEVDAANRRYQGLFTGVFLAVAILHLLLFVFWPETRENLWFALLCGSVAVLEGCIFNYSLTQTPSFLLWVEPAMNTAGIVLCLASLRFVYGVFRPDLFALGWPRRLKVALVPIAVLTILAAVWPARFTTGVFILLLLTSLELLRVIAIAIREKREGSLLVGGGIAAMALGFGVGVLTLLGILPPSYLRSTILPFVSVVILVLTMSVYLSRRVARTSAALRRKLLEVEALSEQKLEHERNARREAVERERLEAEVRHKQLELEEARALQLAMLPRSLPEVADLEVAAHMDTATEVGGDYYDFDLAEDGSLTVAVGDATGHGMKAGTLVTATKSLFKALGEGALVETLDRSSAALKAMNLRQLNMALLLARWRRGHLRVAAAGMPPVYLFRADEGMVDDLLLPGLPLGTPLRGRYQEAQLRLEPGDTVLFMSDGFPERIGPEDEPLGYQRVQQAFADAAEQPARGIVQALLQTSEEWARGRPLDDDMTFVVLKAR